MHTPKPAPETCDIQFISFNDDIVVMQESMLKKQSIMPSCKLFLIILFVFVVIELSICISPWLILILPVTIIISSISLLVYMQKTFDNIIIEHAPSTTSNNSITINVIEDESL